MVFSVAVLLAGCSTPPDENVAKTPQNGSVASTPKDSMVASEGVNMPEGAVAAPEPPKGTGKTPTVEELCKAAGIEPYPGATNTEVQEQKVDLGGDSRFEYRFTTSDNVKKVGQFYEKFKVTSLGDASGTSLMGKTKEGHDVMIGLKTEGGQTMVVIKAIVYTKK